MSPEPRPRAPVHPQYLAASIRAALAQQGANQLGITVLVDDTTVQLTGAVDSAACRVVVVAQVERLAGGRTVVDDLESPEPGPVRAEDLR